MKGGTARRRSSPDRGNTPVPCRAVPKHAKPPDRAVDILRETRDMVWEWTKDRGPVRDWSAAFLADWRDAEYNGRMEEVRGDWRSHAGVGKALVRDLKGVAQSKLPDDEASKRDILRQAIDLMDTLLTGIATAEAHLAVFSC
jgi:hypothetical protein